MQRKGMKRLVLDLRNNPGGQLDQAIRMVNLFVKRGSMIVYTRGRVANSDQEYRATENGEFLHRADDRAGQSQQRERLGDRVAARCRITIARSSSARRRSARRWCSRCIASARAPASR